jgi:HK97 family phage prohead protease
MKKIERRTFVVRDVEARAAEDGTLRLSGYAAVFNESSVPLPFKETIAPGAFRKTLTETPDVRLLVNHEGLPLARTKNGTLTLSEDSKGLYFTADLANTSDARDIHELVARGDVDQMSFAFRVIRQKWSEDRSRRVLTEVSLSDGDVSVVTYPAYPTTNVEARDTLKKLRFVSTQTSEDMAKYQESYDKARAGIAELIALEANEMADGSDETDSLSYLLMSASCLLDWYEDEVSEEGIMLPGSTPDPEGDMPMEGDTAPAAYPEIPVTLDNDKMRKISLRLAKAIINNK